MDDYEAYFQLGIALFTAKKVMTLNFKNGSLKSKPWVSHIVGFHPTYKFKTEFLSRYYFESGTDFTIGIEFHTFGDGLYRFGGILTHLNGEISEGFFAIKNNLIKQIDDDEILLHDDIPRLAKERDNDINLPVFNNDRYVPDDIEF